MTRSIYQLRPEIDETLNGHSDVDGWDEFKTFQKQRNFAKIGYYLTVNHKREVRHGNMATVGRSFNRITLPGLESSMDEVHHLTADYFATPRTYTAK